MPTPPTQTTWCLDGSLVGAPTGTYVAKPHIPRPIHVSTARRDNPEHGFAQRGNTACRPGSRALAGATGSGPARGEHHPRRLRRS